MKLPRGSPGPLTPSPGLTGTTFFFQDSIKGLEEHGESLPGSWCPFLKSLWTWWIMIKLEMVSGGLEKPKEPSLKLLLRSNLWSPVKTIHFLYGPLWSLEGHGGSWQSWKWCQGVRRTPRKLHKKFRWNRTTGSMWNGHFYKNMFYGGLFFASRAPLIHFEWIQKLSNPPHFIHGERWCVQKNPTSKHLAKEHFFWDTLYIKAVITNRKGGSLQSHL